MTTPTTAAGRAMVEVLDTGDEAGRVARRHVLAIEAEARAAALDEEVLAQAIFWVYGTADDARMVVREYKTRLAAIDALRERSGE